MTEGFEVDVTSEEDHQRNCDGERKRKEGTREQDYDGDKLEL